MIEGGGGQNFLRVLRTRQGQSGIAAFGRNQLGGVVGREFVEEEEVGGGGGFAEQLDALADERGDGENFFWRGLEAGLREEGRELAAELVDGQGADVLGVEPDGFGSNGSSSVKLMTALARLTSSRVKAAVSSSRVRNSRSFLGDQPSRQRKLMKAWAGSPRRDRWSR